MAISKNFLSFARLRYLCAFDGHAALIGLDFPCGINSVDKLATTIGFVAQGLSVPISRGSPPAS